MRIGILTYHAVYNFGANLQALSTYMYLKNNGLDPVVIDFFPEGLEEAFSRTVPAIQAAGHRDFIKRHFVLTRRCRNTGEVVEEIRANSIDAVIIGSDAVLQHFPLIARIKINPSLKKIISIKVQPVRYETNFPNPFWGEFMKSTGEAVPVAMMSVSCQDTDYKLIRGQEKREIGKILGKLKYLSVRDIRTRDLVRYISENKFSPPVTPDPVFAFNDNITQLPDFESIRNKYRLPEKYILLSFNSDRTVDKSWIGSFTTLSEKKGYCCVALAMPGGIRFTSDLNIKINIPIDPLDWYCLIKYSSGYVGEKMHPVITALHNNVPFFSFDHYGILKFKLFLNNKTSKIHNILWRSGFKDYRVPIARKITYKAPEPGYVLNKLITFDKEKCTVFSDRMRLEYKEMMQSLLCNLGFNKTDNL